MKKIFGFLAILSALILMAGVAVAETAKNLTPEPIKYTAEQKACVQEAQTKKIASIKTATDNLNSVTGNFLVTKQDALKAAQQIKDPGAKKAAIKAANDAYNNNEAVKQAKVPYMEAIKSANEEYKNDLTACLDGPKGGIGGGVPGFFKGVGNGISGAFSRMWKFLSWKK